MNLIYAKRHDLIFCLKFTKKKHELKKTLITDEKGHLKFTIHKVTPETQKLIKTNR